MTIMSILVYRFLGWNIDAVMGILVSLVVMWAGIGIARDTLEPLIGQAGDPKLAARIRKEVESYDGIVGTHDMILHSYGPGRTMASLHAEVPRDRILRIPMKLLIRRNGRYPENWASFW